MFLSLSFSLPSPLSNKIFKNKNKKVISGDNSYCGQDPKFKSFEGMVKVSPEPTGT